VAVLEPASVVVSLSIDTKMAPPPRTRAKRARARSLRNENGPRLGGEHQRAAAMDRAWLPPPVGFALAIPCVR
jgi:hypothetical protein